VSGYDRCYALPQYQQWETAQVDHYVWGDPAAVDAYGKALHTAGADLASVADSLARVDVSGFWTGAAATAFTQLRDRVVPAVRGLAAMHTDASTALGTWQRHLAVYQEDCAAAITTGRQGWQQYKASCANPDAQTRMNNGQTGISNAVSAATSSGTTCKAAIEAATAKGEVPTPSGAGTTSGQSPEPGSRAPSGQAPVPLTGPIPPGQPRPWVDPATGRVVEPLVGPVPAGQPRPWVYVDQAPTGTPTPTPTPTPAR
jgi:uncharacterized protein YukE